MNKKKVSVIIPCRNEVKYIEECITAIYNSSFSDMIQITVFVVDGMSDDGTRELILALKNKYTSLHLLDNKKKLTPFAFNLGIKTENADYYQIVGARHIVSSNYFQRSIDILEKDSSIWCVGGKLINEYTSKTSEIIAKAMDTSFGMGLGNFRIKTDSGYTDTVTSPMYPASVFDKIGYFDEDLIRNQDDDFNYRVTSKGGKIWFENSICLKYYVRGTYKGLYRQFFQYGYWKVFVNRKHKAVTTMRQMVPPIFVLFTFITPLILISSYRFFVWTTVICWVLYFLMGIYFSFKKSDSNSEKVGIFKTFPILHFSYGLGYLYGILHFLILNKRPDQKQSRLSR